MLAWAARGALSMGHKFDWPVDLMLFAAFEWIFGLFRVRLLSVFPRKFLNFGCFLGKIGRCVIEGKWKGLSVGSHVKLFRSRIKF